jgi:hypothetical protein
MQMMTFNPSVTAVSGLHYKGRPIAVPSPLPSDGRGEGQGEVRVPAEAKLKLTKNMTLSAHLFDISRATDAITLQAYREDVMSDDCLDAAEKEELCRTIEKRFAFLNARTVDRKSPSAN